MFKVTMAFPMGREKALTLSYDDGVDTDIKMIELMEKYGIKGTFNLNSGLFSPEGAERPQGQIHFHLSEKQALKTYSSPAVEVATHSSKHPFLDKVPPVQCMAEIVNDRIALENLFGKIVRGHAYPMGTYNDTVVEILKNAGIVYARHVVSSHNFSIPSDWLRLAPTCHHNDPQLDALTDKFLNGEVGQNEGWLYYLWGHTYEFRAMDNWNLIEDFFKRVSGNDNVWYATNIEVYDYVTAYRSLIYSADTKKVFNPSLTDVWIKIGSNVITVPSGKTVDL